MGTFSERLRASLLAAGMGSLENLSRRSAAHGPLVSAVRIRSLMDDPEAMSARELMTLSRTLKVRGNWLIDGVGPVSPVVTGNQREVQALVAFRELPGERQRIFLALVSKMLQ